MTRLSQLIQMPILTEVNMSPSKLAAGAKSISGIRMGFELEFNIDEEAVKSEPTIDHEITINDVKIKDLVPILKTIPLTRTLQIDTANPDMYNVPGLKSEIQRFVLWALQNVELAEYTPNTLGTVVTLRGQPLFLNNTEVGEKQYYQMVKTRVAPAIIDYAKLYSKENLSAPHMDKFYPGMMKVVQAEPRYEKSFKPRLAELGITDDLTITKLMIDIAIERGEMTDELRKRYGLENAKSDTVWDVWHDLHDGMLDIQLLSDEQYLLMGELIAVDNVIAIMMSIPEMVEYFVCAVLGYAKTVVPQYHEIMDSVRDHIRAALLAAGFESRFVEYFIICGVADAMFASPATMIITSELDDEHLANPAAYRKMAAMFSRIHNTILLASIVEYISNQSGIFGGDDLVDVAATTDSKSIRYGLVSELDVDKIDLNRASEIGIGLSGLMTFDASQFAADYRWDEPGNTFASLPKFLSEPTSSVHRIAILGSLLDRVQSNDADYRSMSDDAVFSVLYDAATAYNAGRNWKNGADPLLPLFIRKFTEDSGFEIAQTGGYHTAAKNDYANWVIEMDSSANSGSLVGYELVSPVMDYADAIVAMRKCLAALDKYASTHRGCGVHINVSRTGYSLDDYDVTKMVLLMGDMHVLSKFDRIGNRYTKSISQKLKSAFDDHRYTELLSGIKRSLYGSSSPDSRAKSQILQLMKQLGTSAILENRPEDRYLAINFIPLTTRGYVEFRAMGGAGYEQRGDEIVHGMHRFAKLIHAGTDPDAHFSDYMTKVVRLIGQSDVGSDINAETVVQFLNKLIRSVTKPVMVELRSDDNQVTPHRVPFTIPTSVIRGSLSSLRALLRSNPKMLSWQAVVSQVPLVQITHMLMVLPEYVEHGTPDDTTDAVLKWLANLASEVAYHHDNRSRIKIPTIGGRTLLSDKTGGLFPLGIDVDISSLAVGVSYGLLTHTNEELAEVTYDPEQGSTGTTAPYVPFVLNTTANLI